MYLLLFMAVVFSQSIICAKYYIVTPKYCSTRFQKLRAIFSIHNIISLYLHIVVGFVGTSLFLGFTSYTLFMEKTDMLNGDTLFLLYAGAWTGFYYFISVYTNEKKVQFPVIQQSKWVQFKAHLFNLFKQSSRTALMPCIYFCILFSLLGSALNELLPYNIDTQNTNTLGMCVTSWIYATLIHLCLNLMNFYYELFLTEPYEFLIVADSPTEESYTLKEALESKIPIIQHLACQDLFLLSGNFSERRALLFQLSNPGNHPHNWNRVIKIMLGLLKEYIDCLNGSLNNILPDNKKDKQKMEDPISMGCPSVTYSEIRRIGINPICETNDLKETRNYIVEVRNNMVNAATAKINSFIETLKKKLGINFIFQELPEASIQKCLGDGQMIIWIVQAMSCLCTKSLIEDRYGIVQKDLPIIVSALVELKLSVEKLNRVPALNRRIGNDDLNCRMKLAILNAIRRSIYNIVANFGPYLNDLNLKNEIVAQLQTVACKNGHYY